MAIRGVRLDGVKECIASFKALEPIVKEELGEATRATLVAIVAIARGLVRVRFGILRDHIDFTYNKKTGQGRVGVRKATIFVSRTDGSQTHLTSIFGSGKAFVDAHKPIKVDPSKYAHLVEFGTVHSRAFPFMIPAVEAQRQAYLQRCREAGLRIEHKATSKAPAFGFGARAA